MEQNEFGKLVRAYRKQRGWTQEELAEHWGYTRTYVTLVESGKKPIDRLSQINRLADILAIPKDRLEAIGKTVAPEPQRPDDKILEMLLTPGREMVKFAWLAWYADVVPNVEENLLQLIRDLDGALTLYHGEFVRPVQQLLSYTHQMMGKISFDRLDYTAASAHFSNMVDLGQELGDSDIITAGMSQQGDLLRKRGRFETAIRCLAACEDEALNASASIQTMRHLLMARAFSCMGDLDRFERSSGLALNLAERGENADNITNGSNRVEALQEQAQGYTMLWKPEKALEIYKETDTLRTFRPLRDQGSYAIVKAQAYAYGGYLDNAEEHALKGLKLASEYKSRRHVLRLDGMYRRLEVLPIGATKEMKSIGEALKATHRKEVDW